MSDDKNTIFVNGAIVNKDYLEDVLTDVRKKKWEQVFFKKRKNIIIVSFAKYQLVEKI